MYILIETADRETGVLKFSTMEEAQNAMYNAFEEVMSHHCNDDEETKTIMKNVYESIEQMGYYQDDESGIDEYSGWFNRSNGGHLDWVIEEIKTKEEEKNAIKYYWNILHSVMKMKMMEARETADKEDDYESYNSGWLEGQYAGLKEAVRTLENSHFLFEKEEE